MWEVRKYLQACSLGGNSNKVNNTLPIRELSLSTLDTGYKMQDAAKTFLFLAQEGCLSLNLRIGF